MEGKGMAILPFLLNPLFFFFPLVVGRVLSSLELPIITGPVPPIPPEKIKIKDLMELMGALVQVEEKKEEEETKREAIRASLIKELHLIQAHEKIFRMRSEERKQILAVLREALQLSIKTKDAELREFVQNLIMEFIRSPILTPEDIEVLIGFKKI